MTDVILHSRKVTIGGSNGVGARTIWIHEMDESEIRYLKYSRWFWAFCGFSAGVLIVVIPLLSALP